MPGFKEPEQVGVTAPGLNTPGHGRIKIAKGHALRPYIIGYFSLGVDAKTSPLFGNHLGPSGHDWPGRPFNDDAIFQGVPSGSSHLPLLSLVNPC